jgi:hypothetical protein
MPHGWVWPSAPARDINIVVERQADPLDGG